MRQFGKLALAFVLLSMPFQPTKAEELTQFFLDFSNYCVDGIGSPVHYKAMADSENWKSLPEELMPLLQNANGDDFDGWAYQRNEGDIFAIAFASGSDNGRAMHTCSLVNLNADYKLNVSLMKKFFKAKRFDEYDMGMQYMELFSIRLPRFSKAMIFTSQDRSSPSGSDMFKFDLAVYE